jgi:hypothetical protein
MAEQLIIILFIEVGILITPLLFIALDFWADIRKAKIRKETITSEKWRRTVGKILMINYSASKISNEFLSKK